MSTDKAPQKEPLPYFIQWQLAMEDNMANAPDLETKSRVGIELIRQQIADRESKRLIVRARHAEFNGQFRQVDESTYLHPDGTRIVLTGTKFHITMPDKRELYLGGEHSENDDNYPVMTVAFSPRTRWVGKAPLLPDERVMLEKYLLDMLLLYGALPYFWDAPAHLNVAPPDVDPER